ncbi:thermonuclease family protein [Candidatus Desulforudis audaxviator]|uniref:thermonuclease family protein n=1 Tax=Candidatus Desulforudis audaxviator TaxID=471827 RepID=UPI000673E443|nr:thermonuclease family protein [Candidatus Desulforudis audaxviator]
MCRCLFGLALLLAVFLACSGCGPPSPEKREQPGEGPVAVRVVRVVDGDTVVVAMPGGAEERLRLIGVDTPEISEPPEPFGLEAAAYSAERLEGRVVFLETDVAPRDRYGRLLGYLWLESPSGHLGEAQLRRNLFNAHLLLDGYAQLMTVPPNVKYADYFREFQREARENGRGLWGAAVDEEDFYVGNSGTRRFHRPDCPSAGQIAPQNRTRFETRTDAFELGYEPCRTCKP